MPNTEFLEELATQMLIDDRKKRGITAINDKKDILLPDQLKLRQEREVTNWWNGYPEVHLVSGMYRRAYNPQAGAHSPGRYSQDLDPWRQDLYEGNGR